MRFASPEDIEALARRLDGQADELDTQVRSFDRDVAAVRWHSSGAQRYRDDCAGVSRDLRANVEDLRAAADEMRSHAQHVRRTVALMHQAFDRLRQEAEDLWSSAEHAADETFEWGAEQAGAAWSTVRSWF